MFMNLNVFSCPEGSGIVREFRPTLCSSLPHRTLARMKLTCLRPRLLQRATPARTGWKADTERGTAHQRGYGYAWSKLRLVILQRDHGLCQCPDCQGGRLRLTPANEVHHIVGKAEARARGWTPDEIDHPSNLQAVNSQCHARITAAQSRGGG